MAATIRITCTSLFNYSDAIKSWVLRRFAPIPRLRVVIDRGG